MNRLRRYQRGGFGNAGLNYSSSFSNPSNTGWKAPGNAPGGLGFGNASLNSSSLTGTGTTKQDSKFDAGQAMNFGTAALGAITSAVGTGMQAKAQIDMINEANRMGREQNLASAKSRVQNMRTSGNQYGTYGTMYGQYGGAVLGYGENLDSGSTERAGQRAITEGTTEGIVSAIPVVGPIIGAATGLVKGVQSAAGKQRAELDGKMIDAYPDETAAAVGNTMKMFTPHQSAFDHAENEDYGRAVLSWTGLGVIPDMIEGMSDQRDYESQRARGARQNFRTEGGTTGGTHLNNQQLAMNAMQDRQIPTAKYGGMMPEYKSGGYRVEKSSDRKGKTHKVTGPDGTVKYFGDPNLGERSESKYGKEAFYSRHKKNLDANPHFRAYARATWETGGMYPDTPEMGMGGYMSTYKGGGLYANIHAKQERIKAGSSESMRPPGSDGAPTDKAFTDSARTEKKYGGLMKYQTGGKIGTMKGVPKEKANALLEGNGKNDTHNGELILRPGGKVMAVKGPRHSEGDTPVVLQAGDRVLSDYTKHPVTGDTIAETYEDALKRGASQAELEGIWNTQEMISGRAPGQGMDQTAKNGGLMKYQTAGLFPKFNRTFNMFEDRPMGTGSVVTMKGMPVSPEVAALVQGKKIETAATTKKKTSPALNKQQMQTIPVKTPYGGSVGNQPSMQTIPTKVLPKSALPTTLPMAYTPAPTTAHLKPTPKDKPNYLKYGPELLSAASSIAAMAATTGQDFNKVPIPQPQRVQADKMFLDRMSPDAELARSQRDFAAMMAANLKMGQGPGASSTIQSAYSDKVRADEQARANADRLNIQIDATEKAGNIDSKMKADMFNEENMARYREMAFAQDTASEAFEREKTQAVVNQLLRGTQGVADTAMNRRYAEAISGDTGALERFKRTGLQADLDKFLASLNKKP